MGLITLLLHRHAAPAAAAGSSPSRRFSKDSTLWGRSLPSTQPTNIIVGARTHSANTLPQEELRLLIGTEWPINFE